MLSIDCKGKFLVRILEYFECPEIEGKIVLVRDITDAGVDVSLTNDCKPEKKVYRLPPSARDNGWYDITQLVLAANATILPKYSRCVFSCEAARSYRNYVDIPMSPLTEQAAVGKLCFLGTISQRSHSLSKQAYYIAAADSQGYMLAYSGFCKPIEDREKPETPQRVLRLAGSGKNLYLAEPIVSACNACCEEDRQQAVTYERAIREMTIRSSVESQSARDVMQSQLSGLNLKGV